jgi:hypothetical protein
MCQADNSDEIGGLFSPKARRAHPFFRDYDSLHSEMSAKGEKVSPMNAAEMRKITAGGYQMFDCSFFPPIPEKNSIAARKLADLKWSQDEFNDMRVMEIGSQLGFFAFHALASGASMAVGIEQNPQFAREANKIALHYKSLCRWKSDLVCFKNSTIMPDDAIPGKPDIIIANSIVHWWVLRDGAVTVTNILRWLAEGCTYGVYFEGCVDASEPIMAQHGVSAERFNEPDFLDACSRVFARVNVIGRCSYNEKRIVVRLLK